MRHQRVSLYVEWTEEADPDTVRNLLCSHGIRIIGIDWDTDLKRTPCLVPRRENAVFRFRMNQQVPFHALLSEVAMLPGVYSVSEIKSFF